MIRYVFKNFINHSIDMEVDDAKEIPIPANMNIENNDVFNNTFCGLEIIGINNANISDNMLFNNGIQGGLYIWGGMKNNVFNNIIHSNICGINITSSNDFSINDNWIFSNNEDVGIKILNCLDEKIFNNYFENSFNAWDDGDNIWNISKTPGSNIINGLYIGQRIV